PAEAASVTMSYVVFGNWLASLNSFSSDTATPALCATSLFRLRYAWRVRIRGYFRLRVHQVAHQDLPNELRTMARSFGPFIRQIGGQAPPPVTALFGHLVHQGGAFFQRPQCRPQRLF